MIKKQNVSRSLGWARFLPLVSAVRVLAVCGCVLALFTIPAYADDSSFVMHEYWRCAPENNAALQEASETIWGPIFDGLVAEGKFLGWGNLTTTGTFKHASADETPEEIESEHQFFGWWESASAEADEAAWAEFFERMEASHPEDRGPWLYCDALTVVTYEK